jgi:hypothetical protein
VADEVRSDEDEEQQNVADQPDYGHHVVNAAVEDGVNDVVELVSVRGHPWRLIAEPQCSDNTALFVCSVGALKHSAVFMDHTTHKAATRVIIDHISGIS